MDLNLAILSKICIFLYMKLSKIMCMSKARFRDILYLNQVTLWKSNRMILESESLVSAFIFLTITLFKQVLNSFPYHETLS